MAGEEIHIRNAKKAVIINLINRVYNQQTQFHYELFVDKVADEVIKLFDELSIKV